MKGPISLYLPAIPHNRLATYIANALDGMGSFSGFVRFIEEENYRGNFEQAGDILDKSEADGPFSELPRLPARKYWQPLGTYSEAWTRFTNALPWFESNPVAAHILALYALRYHTALWASTFEARPDGPPVDLADVWGGVAGTQRSMRHDSSQELDSVVAQLEPAETPQIFRPIFRRNRIELTDQENSEPVSLYLDAQHHQPLYAPLGNRFYERLVHSLVTLLEASDAGIDIEPATSFLELGLDGVSKEALEATSTRIAEDYTDVRVGHKAEGRHTALKREGYISLRDPKLLNRALEETYTRKGEEETIAHLDTGFVLADDLNEDALSILRLGNRLGLIDENPISALPERIAETLRQRHGITELTPTRDNAFRLLSNTTSDDANGTFENAVDMHMWSLFQLYAKRCLPNAAANDPRQFRSTLATLAAPRLFLRQATLEAFTGTTVNKESSGPWKFLKGRSIVQELPNREAIAIGNVLAATVTVDDPITDSSWAGVAQRPLPNSPRQNRSRSIPVGLEALERAQHHLNEQDGDTYLAAKSLAAELLTETAAP